ncbi:hypothetical protein [Streptomyces daliensis]|uniref:Uncharacterized protein n=1 Tax=Streptomyces daliensis TaxID=299421 RepID=A0A8T4ITC6_9ACTN|nr:hypothetical protein [Streptomyces daliensis]
MADRLYTRTEKLTRARLLAKGAKRSAGDISRIERQLDAIDRRAEDRARREAEAHSAALKAARDAVATATVAERTAPRGPERAQAREKRKAAEKHLRSVERARR